MECPDYTCNASTLCTWRGSQTCQLKSLSPAKPTPPWYWTSIKWPNHRLKATGLYWNNLIVFAGGEPDSALVEFYNTTDGTWGTLGTLYQGRSYATVIGLGPYLLISGGISAQQPSAVVDIFNSLNNSWSISHFDVARGQHSAVAVGDEVWFGPTLTTAGFIEAFNPATRKWRTITQNVTGQLAVTQYAVVASGGAIYFKEMDKWSTFKSDMYAAIVSIGSNVVILSRFTLSILDTHGNIWSNASSPVMLPSVAMTAIVSEDVLVFVDQGSLINRMCTLVMYNFTSHEWSNASVPHANIAANYVIHLIGTNRRQTWLYGAVDGSVTVFSWKGYRASFWPPVHASMPSIAPESPTASPIASPQIQTPSTVDSPLAKKDDMTIWPLFVVLGAVAVGAALILLLWLRKRKQKRLQFAEDNISLLSSIEETDEEDVTSAVEHRTLGMMARK